MDQCISTSPVWLTTKQAAQRAQCGPKVIYRAAKSGRLRSTPINGRRDLRFRPDWIDQWLEQSIAKAA